VDDDYLMSVVSDTMTLDVLNALTQEA